MRRHGLLILGALVFASLVAASAGAHTTPQIRAQQAHARAVLAEVNQIGTRLQRVEDQAWTAKQQLARVTESLQANTHKLRDARTNFHNAQLRIMRRLYSLYVGGRPQQQRRGRSRPPPTASRRPRRFSATAAATRRLRTSRSGTSASRTSGAERA